MTWWSGPDNALQLDQFKPGRFDIMGIVPVAYALFAMALGICAGALLRRTLPALAVTLAGFIAVRAAVTLWLRPHYISAVTVTHSVLNGYTPPGSAWQLGQDVVGPHGNLVAAPNGAALYNSPSATSRPPARARPGVLSESRRPAGLPWPASVPSSPTSRAAATGRSRGSRPASSSSSPPACSPWRRSCCSAGTPSTPRRRGRAWRYSTAGSVPR